MRKIFQILYIHFLKKNIFKTFICIAFLFILYNIKTQAQCTFATKSPAATQTPPSDGTLYGPIATSTYRYFQATVAAGVEYIVYSTTAADFLTVWGTSNGTGLLGTGTQYVFFTPTGTTVWIDVSRNATCPTNVFARNIYIEAVPRPTGLPSGVVCIGQTITITGTALAGSGGAGAIGFTGGVTATAFNVTATSLDVVVPAGALSGPITVSNTLVIATSSASLDIRTATGVSFLPTAGGIGDILIISGNSLLGSTNVQINGTAVTGVVVTSTQISGTVAPGTTTGNLTFTDGCGNLVNAGAFNVVTLTNYYSKSAGALNLTTSWGVNTDGSGAAPPNFTNQGQRFNIQNQAAATITAAWTVSGLGAGVNVGDGTNPCNFTVPSTFTFTGSVLSLNANATLTLNRSPIPTLSICTCAPSSTVVFGMAASITIPGIAYGNLTISGAGPTFTFGGNSTIAGTFTISTAGTVRLNNTATPRTFYVNNFDMSSGTFDGGSVDPSSGSYSSYTYFSGNFNKSSGAITNSSPSSINGFIFNGGASQTFSNSGTYLYNVTYILNNTTLVLNSEYTQNGITGTAFYVGAGSTLNCGTNQLSTTASSVTFDIQGTIKTANTAGLNGTAATTLNSTNNPVLLLGTSSTVEYNSSAAAQTFTAHNDYANLTINNSSGAACTLGGASSVSVTLTMTNGILTTTAVNILTLNSGATASLGSANSYIDGPLEYNKASTGATAMNFPVGKGTSFNPFILTPTHSDATSVTYTGEVINSSAMALGFSLPGTIDHVSYLRYWQIDRQAVANLTNSTVRLYYNSGDGVTDHNNLNITKTTGEISPWIDLGGFDQDDGFGAPTGYVTSGPFTSFSIFSLANKIPGTNPLPVELLFFYASLFNNLSFLHWTTLSEINNDYFDIQKSDDLNIWNTIGSVNSAKNSSTPLNYSFIDKEPLTRTTYYRLRQVDFDGQYAYSNIEAVSPNDVVVSKDIKSFYDAASDNIFVTLTSPPGMKYSLKITDIAGMMVYTESGINETTQKSTTIPAFSLRQGLYIVTVLCDNATLTNKLIIVR